MRSNEARFRSKMVMTWKVIGFLVDCTIHTALLFGWSSITEIMKENDFFAQMNSAQNDIRSLNQSESIQIILRSENESCFVDNEEQGAQSQGTQDFWIYRDFQLERIKSLMIVKKSRWYLLWQQACSEFSFWFMVLFEIMLVMVLLDLKFIFCWVWAMFY